MPLDDGVREELDAVPPLDAIESPESRELSHDRLEFDREADEIGRGGNAVVYEATTPEDGSRVAVKEPQPGGTIDKSVIEEILAEAEGWAAVDDHPYIAGVVDWGFGRRPWIAIEYMDGGPLAEYVGEFDPAQRLWTAYAIADGVAYAAGKGLAHHDITPNNVLFRETADGTWMVPKVADWGLARELIQHQGSISQATPEYAAPEHFAAIMPDADVDERTDVYQLGVVCYELLTGVHPNHLRGEVVAPTERAPELPDPVDAVLETALAHEQDDRYGHPWGFRNALRNAVLDALVERPGPATGASAEPAGQPDQPADGGVADPADEQLDGATSEAVEEGGDAEAGGSERDAALEDARERQAESQEELSSAQEARSRRPTSAGDRTWPMSRGGPAQTGWLVDGDGPRSSARVDWTYQTNGVAVTSPSVFGKTVYVGDDSGRVYGLAIGTGEPRWTREFEAGVRTVPAVVEGTAFVGTDSGAVAALDGGSGDVLWTFETGKDVRSSPTVVDGTIYVGSWDGTMYALDADTGDRRWDREVHQVTSSPAVVDGTVYVGSHDGNVYALDTGTGTQQWKYETGQWVSSSPAVLDDVVYIGSNDGTTYSLTTSGDERWAHEAEAAIESSPAVTDDTVYVGSNDHSVYALEASSGEPRWTHETGAFVMSSPVVAGDTVYVGSMDETLYALDADTGTVRWRYDADAYVRTTSTVADGRVYLSSKDGTVHALSPGDS
jgi:outer membrane protein assembly factor BamB